MDSGNVSAIISGVAAIAGVLVGSSFAAIKEAVVGWKRRGKERVYLAVLVVSHLDRFANRCLHVAFDDGTAEGRPAGKDGFTYQSTTTVPSFEPLEIDVDWKVLPDKLMYEILALPARQEHIENRLGMVWEFDDGPEYGEYFWSRQRDYAELGLQVSALARSLRRHAGLPSEEPGPEHWNRDRGFKDVIEKVDAERAAYEERRAKQRVPVL